MELSIHVTDSQIDDMIDDIVTTAFEGGINYWCDEASVDWDAVLEKDSECYASELISRGYQVLLHEEEEDVYHVLDKEKVLKGIEYAVENGWLSVDLQGFDVDSEVADVVIQVAVFGEIIYG